MHEPLESVVLRLPDGLQNVKIGGNHLLPERAATSGIVPVRLANPAVRCEVLVEYRFPTAGPGFDKIRLPLVLPEGTTISSCKANIWSEVDVRTEVAPPWRADRPPRPGDPLGSTSQSGRSLRRAPDHLDLRFEPTATLASLLVPEWSSRKF